MKWKHISITETRVGIGKAEILLSRDGDLRVVKVVGNDRSAINSWLYDEILPIYRKNVKSRSTRKKLK